MRELLAKNTQGDFEVFVAVKMIPDKSTLVIKLENSKKILIIKQKVGVSLVDTFMRTIKVCEFPDSQQLSVLEVTFFLVEFKVTINTVIISTKWCR